MFLLGKFSLTVKMTLHTACACHIYVRCVEPQQPSCDHVETSLALPYLGTFPCVMAFLLFKPVELGFPVLSSRKHPD